MDIPCDRSKKGPIQEIEVVICSDCENLIEGDPDKLADIVGCPSCGSDNLDVTHPSHVSKEHLTMAVRQILRSYQSIDRSSGEHEELLLSLNLLRAKKILKKWHDGKIDWQDYQIYIVNTRKGARTYIRETGKIPAIASGWYSPSWDSSYGTVESRDGKHFIFLNMVIIDKRCWGDILATLIHQTLHVIHPEASEETIEEWTRTICTRSEI